MKRQKIKSTKFIKNNFVRKYLTPGRYFVNQKDF